MFKSLFAAAFVFSLYQGQAFAQGRPDHPTERACATQNKDMCVQLDFLTPLNSSDEGQFNLQVETPQDQEIKDLKVDLWMSMGSHGHGSAPLKIAPLELNQYQVQNAWFVMRGTWLVRVKFTLNDEAFQINVPLEVLE